MTTHQVGKPRGMARPAPGPAGRGKGADQAERPGGASCGRGCHGYGSTRPTPSTPRTARPALPDLFRGRSQLLIYHFMFGPGLQGRLPLLLGNRRRLRRHRRAPGQPRRDALGRCRGRRSTRLLGFPRRKMGWSFPWASSAGQLHSTPISPSR